MDTVDPVTDRTPELLNLIAGSWTSDALAAALALELPRLLTEKPRDATELATVTRCEPAALARLLRALATIDICAEGPDGCFAMTPMGARLHADHPQSLHFWSISWTRAMRPLWSHLLESVRTGQSVTKAVTGFESFERQERDPAAAASFNKTMAELTRLVAGDVVRAYDFTAVRTVVDVGGGYGELLLEILRQAPRLTGVLFDLPHAIDGARQRVAEARFSSRCRCLAGDFFDGVPPGADLYVLKSIIHDWPDERAQLILENCHRAMPARGRLLLVERVRPDRSQSCETHRQIARSDLTMLLGLGSQERSEGEFRTLLTSAGFRLTRIDPGPLTFSLIEAVPLVR
jgi:SAM-dependent methyltransferase